MMLLRDDLKIDSENIKLHKNKTKEEILELFKDLQSQSDQFEKDHEDVKHAYKAIIVHWVGFCLQEQHHTFMEKFEDEIDEDLFPRIFQLTQTGQPIALSQLLLRLSHNSKTSTIFLQDD